MIEYYRPVLAIHIIAIISWMAGILYLYRLLIYASEKGSDNKEIFDLLSLMSRRLYKYITIPALVGSWIAGLFLVISVPGYVLQKWFLLKFSAVLLLTAYTFLAGKYVTDYKTQRRQLPSSKTLRFYNEIPTALMIFIVFMVILKPFS